MNNHLRDHAKEEVLDQTESEAGLRPVVAPFKNVEHVAIELNFTIEVLFLEGLDGNLLLAVVSVAVLLLLEFQVVLDVLAWQLGLLVLARRELRSEPPEGTKDGQSCDQSNEDPCLEATTQLIGEVGGNTD